MLVRAYSYPRAGLIGNPSDGYNGKTISFILRNFTAEVVLYESPELQILPAERDHMFFESISDLVRDTKVFGYYGGLRLLKASVKVFYEYCQLTGVSIDRRNFTIRYSSDIPSQVGMAGSSAIITACFRALMAFYEVQIPKPVLANLVLSVETEELNIPAGLQDRVVQAYEGLVYMDFAVEHFAEYGHGRYEELESSLLPPLYVAYSTRLSECTEVFHNDISSRYRRGEKEVVDAMAYWADLAVRMREALLAGDHASIPALLNANFDRRRQLFQIAKGNLDMVDAARGLGASAKFTGSGGAIVGTYHGEDMYAALEKKFAPMGVRIFRPMIEEVGGPVHSANGGVRTEEDPISIQ